MPSTRRTPSAAPWQFLGSQGGSFIAAAAVLSIAVVCCVAWVLAIAAEPWRQPGETWSQGFLSGETIRVLDSGRYVKSSWCDICESEYSSGTWHRDSSRIVLVSSSGSQRVLHRVSYGGCEYLVREGFVDTPGIWDFRLRREGEWCEPEADAPCRDEI